MNHIPMTLGLLAAWTLPTTNPTSTDAAAPLPDHDLGILASGPITPGFLAPWLETRTGWSAAPAAAVLFDLAPPPHGDACLEIASLARYGSLVEARANYLFAIATCINEGGSLWRCAIRTREEFEEAIELAGEQFDARRRVCRLTGGGRYYPDLDPDDFSTTIDNSYFPMIPGRTLVYRSETEDGVEIIRVSLQEDTIEIGDFECAIVRDVVELDGEVIEDTDDWYGQDSCGNVWYFGEIAKNYEDGFLTDIDGSWKHDEDGALAGILMKDDPRVGDTYRQEFYLNEAEDVGSVIALGQTVTVPAGTFNNCLQTLDWTPLEPDTFEHKFYVRGVGVVLEVDLESGDRVELIRIIDR